MKRLFLDLGKAKIDCLIQSSQIGRFKNRHPYINFIDIYQEGFYNLSVQVLDIIANEIYDQLYVTFSGIKGNNYDNIIELINKLNYKEAFFYNCNGDKIKIPEKNIINDLLIKVYIRFIDLSYKLKKGIKRCAE